MTKTLNELRAEYEQLLQQYQELQDRLRELREEMAKQGIRPPQLPPNA